MKKNKDIRIHGRGGQGSVTAAEILAVASFYDGLYPQAFPSFGVERRGAPVSAFCRLSDKPIRLREQIYEPDFLIIQDATLLTSDPAIKQGVSKDTVILLNSEKTDWPTIAGAHLCTVPATKIAMEKIGKPFINTALLGAFAGLSGLVSLTSLKKAVCERFTGALTEPNLSALQAGYDFIKENYQILYEN